MRILAIVFLLVCGVAGGVTTAQSQTFGIQYGPRSFWPAPVGTTAISTNYETLNGGISINGRILKGFEITTHAAIASVSHYFDFFGHTASVVASLPYVWLDGDLNTAVGTIPVFSESGISDPYFQFYTTLVGGEAQSLEDFVRKEPGFIVGLYAAVRPPIGEYDSTKLANPGVNRWEGRIGLPIQYIMGLPTQQTSFEFVPTVYILGDNDKLFGGGKLGQEPVFQFEGHITHDLNQIFWGSLNLLYAFGGETSVNGVGQNDAIAYLAGGATVGARIAPSLGANLSVGTRLWSKLSGTDGHWLRFSLTKTF